MKRLLFIINPHAGNHTVEDFESELESSLDILEERGIERPEVDHLVCDTPEQLRTALRGRLFEDGVDMVGVVGGDGTIMEVLPVMVEFPHIDLALIPYGTGNLLAVNLGIPRDFTSSLEVALSGVSRLIDVGKIGHHYFALLAGVGTVAEIMENTPSTRKKLLGMWAYLVDGIRCVLVTRRAWFRVTLDGKSMSALGVSVVVSNAATLMQPCPALTPEALPDDGLLDVCIIKSQSRRDYLPTVFELLTRQHVNSPTATLSYYQARKIRIESWPRLKVQADGNIIGKTPVNIEIVGKRLKVRVPSETLEETKPIQRPEPEKMEGLLELLKSYIVA